MRSETWDQISVLREILFLSLISVLWFLVSWCWTSLISSTTKTEVAGFLLNIPSDFTETNPSLVENKQIIDKVIKAWKQDKTSGFDPTLLFTKSLIGPELDYEQFYTINSKKFEQYIPGYIKGDKQLISFSCGQQKIKGLWVTFAVKSGFLDDETMYHFWQYQFVHAGSGYILSYASDVVKERDGMKESLTTIACK